MSLAALDSPKEFAGRFTIVEELVKRASCIIYKATDKNLGNREVAVKVFIDRPNGNPEAIKAFEEEISKLKGASHPSLVPVIAGGCEGDWFYLAMELILPGETVRDALKESSGKLPVQTAVEIFKEMAEATGEIHQQGIFHGHIDSRAVLYKGDKVRLAGYYPRAVDKIQSQATSVGRFTVDPSYIAPEQLGQGGELDKRVDIYALAVLMFEMVTGQRPFSAGNPLQTAMLRLTQNPPSPSKLNPEVTPLLDAAILKGLSRDPKGRFASVADFVDAVIGGKKGHSNPLAELAGGQFGTETIAVSMSTEALKDILRGHDARPKPAAPSGGGADSTGSFKSPSGDAQQTVTGMKAVAAGSGPQASLFGIDGPLKGKKYAIEKAQIMVGSDPGCDVVVAEKGVPARYAIIVRRGDSFSAGPLSPAGISINGSKNSSGEEVELKRGDVLNVGGSKLRYVAPGEVFTFKENVADRSIDRPKSKVPIVLATLAILLAVFGYYAMNRYNQSMEAEKSRVAREKKEKETKKEALIAQLIREGDEYFRAGSLNSPIGANAKEKFEKILEVDAEHGYAKRRLAEIDERAAAMEELRRSRELVSQQVDQLMKSADGYFKAGDYVAPPGRNAKEMYLKVLGVDPANDIAKAKLDEIQKLLGNVVERVNALLVKANTQAEQGHFVVPRDDNAFETVQAIFKIDPSNDQARELLYVMASKSVYNGDVSKAALKQDDMKKQYLTAQALGVDPDFIKDKLHGTDIMGRTRSEVIIVDVGGDKNKKEDKNSKYLDTEVIKRRVSEMQMLQGGDKNGKFIDLKRR